MSEMVERVAKAMSIKDKAGDYWDVMSEDGDGHGYVGKNEYRDMARAAIEAMREPTEAMVKAMCGSDVLAEEAKLSWQAAIDEALK